MNASFSNALELNGMSSTTSLIVWAMVIFLILLIGGLGFAFKRLYSTRKTEEESKFSKQQAAKGF